MMQATVGTVSRAIAACERAIAPLLHVTALLVPDQHDRAAVELPEAGDERPVVGAAPVAVQLEPVVEQPLDVVERVGPLGVASKLDRTPDRLVARVLAQPLELPLDPLRLTVHAR